MIDTRGSGNPVVLEYLAEMGHYPEAERPSSAKDRYIFRCPFPGHNDTKPSFTVSADGRQWTCWPCGYQLQGIKKLRELLGGGDAVMAPPRPEPRPKKRRDVAEEPLQGASLKALSRAKHGALPVQHLRDMGWRDTKYAGVDAVRIPYGPGATRFRVGLTGDRFRWQTGSKPSLYGMEQRDSIREAGRVLLVEGETDVAAARLMGIPAIGVPGASNWRPEWAELLAGLEVSVWKEPDQGGETLVRKVGADIDGVRVIPAPAGVKDLCELLDQAGSPESARAIFDELAEDAEVYQRPVAERLFQPRKIPPGMPDWLSAIFRGEATIPPKSGGFEHENALNVASVVVAPDGAKEPYTTLATFDPEWVKITGLSGRDFDRKRSEKLLAAARWEHWRESFPDDPNSPPEGVLGIFGERARPTCGFAAVLYSTTWQSPSNLQNNKRKIGFHLHPRLWKHLAGGGKLYTATKSSDDWGSSREIDNFGNRLRRHGVQWFAADNRLSRGEVPIIASAQVGPEWVEVPSWEVRALLVSLLEGMSAGAPGAGHYWGCAEWKDNLTDSPDKLAERADLLGLVQVGSYAGVAAMLSNQGCRVDYSERKAFLAQLGNTLCVSKTSPKTLAQAVLTFNGLLTRKGKEALGWVDPPDVPEASAAAVDLEQFQATQAALRQRAAAKFKADAAKRRGAKKFTP